MALRGKPMIWLAAGLLLPLSAVSAQPLQPDKVDNIKQAFARLYSCWKPPPNAHFDIEITVIVSFNHEGNILGHPRISFQSQQATDDDRLAYRIAAMEALQRCTPMPFTEGMAGAVAGRPFAVHYRNPKPTPQPKEKTAWLKQKTP
jgi:hypothetical protein